MLMLLLEVFLLTVRSLWSAGLTCLQVLLEVVNFHANMCLRFISWTVNITTLPLRALSALQKEKTMGSFLQELQIEVEDLAWKNEKLEARLKMAVKERHLIEAMLAELEEQHEEAIGKIERLEKQVEFLKDENVRLRESNSKGHWDSNKSTVADEPIRSAVKVQKKISPAQMLRKRTENATRLLDPPSSLVLSRDIDLAREQRREVALFQSVFSALLSLLVGVIMWEAEDPCMPLVVALFSVVGLSLRSVVQFFSTINNKPASDAVALLSFNWFILGTLTAPTLPKVAPLVSPVVVAFLRPVFRGLGLSSSDVSSL